MCLRVLDDNSVMNTEDSAIADASRKTNIAKLVRIVPKSRRKLTRQ